MKWIGVIGRCFGGGLLIIGGACFADALLAGASVSSATRDQSTNCRGGCYVARTTFDSECPDAAGAFGPNPPAILDCNDVDCEVIDPEANPIKFKCPQEGARENTTKINDGWFYFCQTASAGVLDCNMDQDFYCYRVVRCTACKLNNAGDVICDKTPGGFEYNEVNHTPGGAACQDGT